MATKTTTFTSSGTFAAPSTLLNGTVSLSVYGSAGVPSGYPVAGGHGGYVGGTLAVSPSGALTIRVPWTSGGAGGVNNTGVHASPGGSSSAVLQTVSGTLTLQIVAGGGGAEGTKYELQAGTGGNPGTNGQGGGASGGKGASGGTGGAGGSGLTGAASGAAGGNASANSATGTGGAGANGTNAGGGGGGGYAGGGGGGAGSVTTDIEGTGGGGSSFASASVTGVTYTTGANAGAGYVTVTYTYTYADPPAAPGVTSPATGATVNVAAGLPVTFTYRPNTDSGTLNGYACKIQPIGGTAKWLTAAGGLAATPTWISCSSTTKTFSIPGSLFTPGTKTLISVATRESHYTLEGTYSTPVGVTPYTVPAAPTLTGAAGGTTTVTLTWTAPATDGGSAVTGYDVFKGATSGGESATPVSPSPIPVTDTSYIVSGLSSGTYYFTVKALNAAGSSAASNELSTATSSPLPFVAAPSLAAEATTDPVSGAPQVTLTVTNNEPAQPGVAGSAVAVVLRSDGRFVIGASPMFPVAFDATGTVTVVDRQAPYGVQVGYTAFVTYGGTESAPSPAQHVQMGECPDTTALYGRLGYAQTEDASGQLLAWLSGIGSMLWASDGYAAEQMDTEGNVAPGWSQLFDLERCPTEALPWLAQFVGARLNTALRDDQQRYAIANPQGFARGTPAAILAAANQFLRPGYTATLIERDTSAYHLTVKIPQVAVAGLSTFSEIPLDYATYADFNAAFATYQAIWRTTAEITAAVKAAVPAGLICDVVFD